MICPGCYFADKGCWRHWNFDAWHCRTYNKDITTVDQVRFSVKEIIKAWTY